MSGAEFTDEGGLGDEITVHLNGERIPQPGEQLPSIGARPAIDADHAVWAAYAVSLGLDAAVAAERDRTDLIRWCEPAPYTG